MAKMAFIWIFHAKSGSHGGCKIEKTQIDRLYQMHISDYRNADIAIHYSSFEQKDERSKDWVLIRRF